MSDATDRPGCRSRTVAPAPGPRRLLRSPSGLVGLVLIALVVLLALGRAARPDALRPGRSRTSCSALQGPSGAHWFGTDQFGRDIFSRVAAGRRQLAADRRRRGRRGGRSSASCSGVLAGFFGGVLDRVVGGVTNVLFAFPPLLLALALASVLERNWLTVEPGDRVGLHADLHAGGPRAGAVAAGDRVRHGRDGDRPRAGCRSSSPRAAEHERRSSSSRSPCRCRGRCSPRRR